jgi:hypothetical protein
MTRNLSLPQHSWLTALFAAAAAVFISISTLHAFPNITNVVETNGDGEATDTIIAAWTGVTFTNGVANEPIAGKAANAPYTVGFFGEEAPMFVDRNHQWNGATTTLPLPKYLAGGEYIMSGNDNRDNNSPNPLYQLDISIAEASYVYMLVDDRMGDNANGNPPNFPDWLGDLTGDGSPDMEWLLQQGWLPVKSGLNRFNNPDWPDHIGADEGGDGVGPGVAINQYSSVYVKRIPAGTFSIFQADNPGRNMYGVVIKPVPRNPFVTKAIGNLFGVTFDITDGSQTALNTNSITLTLDGTGATPLTITKVNDVTTIKYTAPTVLPSGATITANLTFSDNGTPVLTTNEVLTFTVETYGTLTPAHAVPLSSVNTASPGFTVRVVQGLDSAHWPGNDFPNNTQRAEDQLANRLRDPVTGQRLTTNYATAGPGPGGTYTTNLINWNQEMNVGGTTVEIGNFQSTNTPPFPDQPVPGIANTDPETGLSNLDNIAAEIIAYLELIPGLHRWGVNSDDGFRVTAGVDPRDPGTQVLGVFNGGRGSADSLFYVQVQAAGVYPVRLIWYEGGGGANLEFFSVNQTTGQKILINDLSNPNGIKAYSALTTTARPYVSVSPVGNGANVYAGTEIVAQIFDQTTSVASGSVSLSFNGAPVTASISKTGAVTWVVYDPPGLLPSSSTNTATLVYSDTGSPAITVTNTWWFVAQNYSAFPTIPPSYALPLSNVDTNSSGFTADVYQMGDDNLIVVARTGFPNNNQVEAGERQIARGYTNATTSQPYQNLASPGTEPDGRHVIDTLNWNELAPANQGVFTAAVGFDDVEIPGLPAADQNWVAAEAITYLDLKAGVYRFGVNCDDGFKLSTSPTPRSPSGLQLGLRSPGGGVADAFADFVVQQDGIYPIRLLWWEGTGGANVEFYVVEQNQGARRLINDRNSYFAIKAYRVATAAPPAPQITSATISGGNITVQWINGGTLESSTVVSGGTWTSTGDSDGSFSETVATGNKFYRVRR